MAGIGTPNPASGSAAAKVTGAAALRLRRPCPKSGLSPAGDSASSRGRITAIDRTEPAPRSPACSTCSPTKTSATSVGKTFDGGGYMGTTIAPIDSTRSGMAARSSAVVVAERFEAAREAAHDGRDRLRCAGPPSAGFDTPARKRAIRRKEAPKSTRIPSVGDAARPSPTAPVKIDASYSRRHRSITTRSSSSPPPVPGTAELTVHEPSQNRVGLKHGLAQQLGIDPGRVHASSPICRRRIRLEGSAYAAHRLVAVAAPDASAGRSSSSPRATRASPSPPIAPRRATIFGWARAATASSPRSCTRVGR